jgi:hypothetical protein
MGLGIPSQTSPKHLSSPKQKPDQKSSVVIDVHSSKSLEVKSLHPESDGEDFVSQYKVEWDKAESFDSGNGSPLGSDHVYISPGSPKCDPCTFIIAGLVTGEPYYVRVYSYTSFGYSSLAKYSEPLVMAPRTQARPPSDLHISPLSQTSVRAKFPASLDNGGQNITKYRFDWLSMMELENDTAQRTSERLCMEFPMQTITITTTEHNLSGYFYVMFENHISDKIHATAITDEMKVILEEAKTQNHFVHQWHIRFLTNRGGNLDGSAMSVLKVSIDEPTFHSDFKITSEGPGTLLGTNAEISMSVNVQSYDGVESIETSCSDPSSSIRGLFQITFGSASTRCIPHDCRDQKLKEEIESIEGIGKVLVSRKVSDKGIETYQWTIAFLENIGNLPLLQASGDLTCSDSTAGKIFVAETASGVGIHAD